MGIFIAIVALLCVYEIARIAALYKRIHQPIRRHVRKWKRFNKSASSVLNPNLSLYRYAYSQLPIEQLKHVKLSIDSEKSVSLFTIMLDLLLKIFLPVATFFFGIITALANNDVNISLPQQDLTLQQIGETLYLLITEHADSLIIPMAIVLCAVLIVTFPHLLYKNLKNNVISKLATLLDQLISEGAAEKNVFKSGTHLLEEEDFRSAAFFQIPIGVFDNEKKPVSRGIIRKTSFVSVTIGQQSYEKNGFEFKVI